MKPTNQILFTLVFCMMSAFSFTMAESYTLYPTTEGKPDFQFNHPKEKGEEAIPRRLAFKFRRDAARLALRLAANTEELSYQNIVIPKDHIEKIYNLLTAVYLSSPEAEAVAKCNIHTFPNPSIDNLVIIFDRSADWAEPLHQGITETTSPIINGLLARYDLVIEKYVQWDDTQDALTIRSKEPLNMAALAQEFYNVDGVESIDLGIPKVGGNDIKLLRTDGAWQIQFVMQFGSLLSEGGKPILGLMILPIKG